MIKFCLFNHASEACYLDLQILSLRLEELRQKRFSVGSMWVPTITSPSICNGKLSIILLHSINQSITPLYFRFYSSINSSLIITFIMVFLFECGSTIFKASSTNSVKIGICIEESRIFAGLSALSICRIKSLKCLFSSIDFKLSD